MCAKLGRGEATQHHIGQGADRRAADQVGEWDLSGTQGGCGPNLWHIC